MHLYDDIGDASSSLRGSTSSYFCKNCLSDTTVIEGGRERKRSSDLSFSLGDKLVYIFNAVLRHFWENRNKTPWFVYFIYQEDK